MRYSRHCLAHYNILPILSTLFTLVRHPHQHINHLIHAGTPTTSTLSPCHPRQYVNHVIQVSTPHTLARHPRKHTTHTTHSSTLAHYPLHPRQHASYASTSPTLARHPRQHVQHAISQTLSIQYHFFAKFRLLKDLIGRSQNISKSRLLISTKIYLNES